MKKKKNNAEVQQLQLMRRTAIVMPIVFLAVSVFLTRSNVLWFYILSGALILSIMFLLRKITLGSYEKIGFVFIVLAAIGLSAATILTIEKIELLKDPQRVTSCSFSPVVACSPVISSPQASTFDGIPNPVFGIFGFSAILTAGMTIIAGVRKLHRYWWYALLAGIVFGVVFCMWLIHEALYDIVALCLYCMAVWLVTFSLFWFTLSFMIKENILSLHSGIGSFIVKQRDNLIMVSIVIVLLLIYFRWTEYWQDLL